MSINTPYALPIGMNVYQTGDHCEVSVRQIFLSLISLRKVNRFSSSLVSTQLKIIRLCWQSMAKYYYLGQINHHILPDICKCLELKNTKKNLQTNYKILSTKQRYRVNALLHTSKEP